MIIFALLITAQSSNLPPPEEMVRRVVACGVSDKRVSIDYGTPEQEDVVEIRRLRSLSENQLHCIAEASLDTGVGVKPTREAVGTYYPIHRQVSLERDRAATETWLRDRNLLDKVPHYDPKQEEDYWAKVYALCDIDPGQLDLKVGQDKEMVDRLKATAQAFMNLSEESRACWINVATLSDSPGSVSVIVNREQTTFRELR